MIVRTEKEIDALFDRLPGAGDPSKYPGQNYEDGIRTVIWWLTDKLIEAKDIY